MSKLFGEVQELCEKINYPILLDFTAGKWFYTEDTVWWEEDGNVYCEEIFEGTYIQDGCMLMNVNNGCGISITKVFLMEQEQSEEVFTILYEGQM